MFINEIVKVGTHKAPSIKVAEAIMSFDNLKVLLCFALSLQRVLIPFFLIY